jgi:chemotaxis protein CheY-P-specific phosphatase CheC
MSSDVQPLSPVQAEMLRQILSQGNDQVGGTLQMILGQEPHDLTVKTSMIRLMELDRKIPDGPMVSVRIQFEGDIKGLFLLLLPQGNPHGEQAAFKALFSGQSGGEYDPASYVRADWVQPGQGQVNSSDERIRDTMSELGNVLFGAYLTALYSRCSMATFLELPEVLYPDNERDYLTEALEHYRQVAERSFMVEVKGSLGEHPIHFWLVMMAEAKGFKSMLEAVSERPEP